eukprot:Sspe_Gene.113741::Locus_98482_Transcript_1_1_Confidence_1.000_Length_370::g.113741::m.113741
MGLTIDDLPSPDTRTARASLDSFDLTADILDLSSFQRYRPGTQPGLVFDQPPAFRLRHPTGATTNSSSGWDDAFVEKQVVDLTDSSPIPSRTLPPDSDSDSSPEGEDQ